MKINGNKLWFAGLLISSMAFFSLGETKNSLTENDMVGILGIFFMAFGLCIEKE